MSDYREESSGVDSTTVGVFRTAATIKGGRRFSFGALVVVGDRNGSVGIGYGKANEVPPAIEKAEKEAKRSLKRMSLKGGTIPHTVVGRFGASKVKLVPASPGTGVVAGGTVRTVLELVGVRDCLTKSFGSTNRKNLVKATLAGLEQLRSKEEVERLRGVSLPMTHVEEIVERGAAFHAPVATKPPAAAAQNGRKPKPSRRGKSQAQGGQGQAQGEAESKPDVKAQTEPEKVSPPKADDTPTGPESGDDSAAS